MSEKMGSSGSPEKKGPDRLKTAQSPGEQKARRIGRRTAAFGLAATLAGAGGYFAAPPTVREIWGQDRKEIETQKALLEKQLRELPEARPKRDKLDKKEEEGWYERMKRKARDYAGDVSDTVQDLKATPQQIWLNLRIVKLEALAFRYDTTYALAFMIYAGAIFLLTKGTIRTWLEDNAQFGQDKKRDDFANKLADRMDAIEVKLGELTQRAESGEPVSREEYLQLTGDIAQINQMALEAFFPQKKTNEPTTSPAPEEEKKPDTETA